MQEHVAGLARDDYFLDRYRVLLTSGTTSVPRVAVFDSREWSTVLSTLMRRTSLAGRNRGLGRRRVSVIGPWGIQRTIYRYSRVLSLGLNNVQRLNALLPLADVVAALNSFRPSTLATYPSVAALLATEQLAGRLEISPDRIFTSAEVMTGGHSATIAEAWGIEPFDAYGMTETGVIAASCFQRRGLHVFEDLFLVEVVDGKGRPVKAGETGAKVLLTSFFHTTVPLIRYEVSDMLTLSPEPCSCGRPHALLKAIEGRVEEVLYMAGSNGERVPVPPIHFRGLTRDVPGVSQCQVRQQGDDLCLRVVLSPTEEPGEVLSAVRRRVEFQLAAIGASAREIQVEPAENIERNEQTGKLELVVLDRKAHESHLPVAARSRLRQGDCHKRWPQTPFWLVARTDRAPAGREAAAACGARGGEIGLLSGSVRRS